MLCRRLEANDEDILGRRSYLRNYILQNKQTLIPVLSLNQKF